MSAVSCVTEWGNTRKRADILSMKLHAWKREDINPEGVETWNADYRGMQSLMIVRSQVRMILKQEEKGGLLEVRRLRE